MHTEFRPCADVVAGRAYRLLLSITRAVVGTSMSLPEHALDHEGRAMAVKRAAARWARRFQDHPVSRCARAALDDRRARALSSLDAALAACADDELAYWSGAVLIYHRVSGERGDGA